MLLWLAILSTFTSKFDRGASVVHIALVDNIVHHYCLRFYRGASVVHIALVGNIVHHYCLRFYRGAILNVFIGLIVKYYCFDKELGRIVGLGYIVSHFSFRFHTILVRIADDAFIGKGRVLYIIIVVDCMFSCYCFTVLFSLHIMAFLMHLIPATFPNPIPIDLSVIPQLEIVD